MNWLWWIAGCIAVVFISYPIFMLSGQFSKEEEKRANREAAKKLPYLEDSQWN